MYKMKTDIYIIDVYPSSWEIS